MPSYEEVFDWWGIPDPTKGKEFGAMKDAAKHGYGKDYVSDAATPMLRGITGEGATKRRSAMYGLDTKFGNSFSLGAAGRIEGDMRAGTAGKAGEALLGIQSQNQEARSRAQQSLLSTLMQHQSTIAGVMGTYQSLEQQAEVAKDQLDAQEPSWVVAAEYGLTSIEEKLIQTWKRMHLRMDHGKKSKLKLWRVVFTGYHRAAPWVARHSSRWSVSLKMRKYIVDRFVKYVLCDVWKHRRATLSERFAAYIMLCISLCGWRLNNV